MRTFERPLVECVARQLGLVEALEPVAKVIEQIRAIERHAGLCIAAQVAKELPVRLGVRGIKQGRVMQHHRIEVICAVLSSTPHRGAQAFSQCIRLPLRGRHADLGGDAPVGGTRKQRAKARFDVAVGLRRVDEADARTRGAIQDPANFRGRDRRGGACDSVGEAELCCPEHQLHVGFTLVPAPRAVRGRPRPAGHR
jgi:hypothetical protein